MSSSPSSAATSAAAASSSSSLAPAVATSVGGGAGPDPDVVVETWHSFIYDAAPVQAMQTVLETVHATTGLPWWATISLSTLAFRLSLLPIFRYQAFAVDRLVKAGPLLGALNQAMSNRLDQIKPGDTKGTAEACRVYASGLSSALKMKKVSLLGAMASPLVQIPVFITFALANRRMIDNEVDGLEEEGLAWFQDLTEADPLLILPIMCLSSTYANLELSFANLRESQTILRFFKDNFQLLLILGAPITSTLPSGVFVYWLTSSLYGHAQHFAFKNANFRKALGFSPLPSSAAPSQGGSGDMMSSSSSVASSSQVIVPAGLMKKALEALDEYEQRKLKKK